MTRYLFGYGTLREDIPEDRSDPPYPARLVGRAWVPGRLVVWAHRWAGLLPPEMDNSMSRSRVFGQVWELQSPHRAYDWVDEQYEREDWLEARWDNLDARERYYPDSPATSNYHRRPITLVLDGRDIEAFTYYLNMRKIERISTIDIERVPSGDWADWLKERRAS